MGNHGETAQLDGFLFGDLSPENKPPAKFLRERTKPGRFLIVDEASGPHRVVEVQQTHGKPMQRPQMQTPVNMPSGIPVRPFPSTGFVRLDQIVRPSGVMPFSASTWWRGVRAGIYPEPIKFGPNISAWRAEDILDLIDKISERGGEA